MVFRNIHKRLQRDKDLGKTKKVLYGVIGIATAVGVIAIISETAIGSVLTSKTISTVNNLTNNTNGLSSKVEQSKDNPKIEVPVDLKAEEEEQKSVDAGHSPWKLDPAFVAQVFVSLKIYPQGIQGDYPIKYEELKVIQNNEKEAIVEVSSKDTPIRRVYLKRLIRQDRTGIWTVVGYDPVDK